MDKKVIEVKTKQSFEAFMRRLEKAGFMWRTGVAPTQSADVWGKYKPLCVQIDEPARELMYGAKEDFIALGATIIAPKEYVVPAVEDRPTDVQNGEWVPRTYRLIRDLPDILRGAIFQEVSPNSVYGLLNPEFVRYESDAQYFKGKLPSLGRDSVEKNPKWFEEVFRANPVYMNVSEMELLVKYLKRTKKGKK